MGSLRGHARRVTTRRRRSARSTTTWKATSPANDRQRAAGPAAPAAPARSDHGFAFWQGTDDPTKKRTVAAGSRDVFIAIAQAASAAADGVVAVDLDGISADEIDTGEQPLPEEATVEAFGRVMEENVQVTQAPAIRDLRARKPLGMIDMTELLRPDLWLAARPPTVGGLRRPTSLPTEGKDPTSPATPIRETMATPALRALGAFSESITKELRLNASINELWPEAGGARFVAAGGWSARWR